LAWSGGSKNGSLSFDLLASLTFTIVSKRNEHVFLDQQGLFIFRSGSTRIEIVTVTFWLTLEGKIWNTTVGFASLRYRLFEAQAVCLEILVSDERKL
jgi:hypothetical protein